MIIQSKIQGRGFQNRSLKGRSLGAIGVWSVAILFGSLVAACSGTIETPTEEFPAREGGSSQATDDDDDTPPRTPAPAASNNDDDDEPTGPVASNDDDEPVDAQEPPADDTEEPPADDTEEPAPAGDLSFASDISPIFSTSCGGCHGPAGFAGVSVADPDTEAALESAVNFEDAVIENIEAGDMPPPCNGGAPGDSGCVSAEDFADIQAWYEAGAPE
jgi:cytochrome c553